jgi:maltoporin
MGWWIANSTLLLAADSPELDAFRKQIEAQLTEIKASYEGRIRQLESRITTLESDNTRLQRNAARPATAADAAELAQMKKRVADLEARAGRAAPAVEAAAERTQANAAAIEQIQRNIQASATESREIYREPSGFPFDPRLLYKLPQPFEYHGYFRAGFGLNGKEGEMEAFKAPGAGAKYRLGNEAETYGEFELTHNWLREDDPLKSPYVRSTVMVSYLTGQNDTYDSFNATQLGNDIALRQAFVEMGNVFRDVPEVRFWAGQRYYRRQDIHINDFYWLDMSGYGAGLQDVPLVAGAKLAFAWLGGSFDTYQTDQGKAAKHSFDLRVYDIPAPFGKLGVWLDYARSPGGEVRNVFDPTGDRFSLQTSHGWAAAIKHRTAPEAFLGGYNELSVQYGNGAAYNYAATIDVASPEIDDASRFRVTDHFTIEPAPWLSMQVAGVYQSTKYGGPNSREDWWSFGLRPIFHFNDVFSVALESGVDYVDSQPLGVSDYLWKITLSPQISRGRKFFSRPALRTYVTYAKWGSDFRGKVGGSAYRDALEGLSYGVQVESWW